MRTFKLELALDVRAVVPDSFVQQMRSEATGPDATAFLMNAQEMFPLPTQDEDFILHILKHGVRRNVRQSLLTLFGESGLGCTLSPAKATVINRSPPSAKPVLAYVINT